MNNTDGKMPDKSEYTKNTTARQAYNEYRIEKGRKRKAKRVARYFGVVFFFILCFATAAFLLIFRIKTVSFTGTELYTDKQLSSGAGFSFLSNYFLVSERKISDNLSESYPALETVSVKKSFPSKVEITVKENNPEFFLTIGSLTYILDNKLVVHRIAKNIEETEAMSLKQLSLSGVSSCIAGKYVETEDKDIVKMFEVLYDNLVKYNLINEVTSVDFSDKFDIRFTLGAKYTIKIGNILECENKIEFVNRFLPQIYNLDIHIIDVTDENVQKIIVSKH